MKRVQFLCTRGTVPTEDRLLRFAYGVSLDKGATPASCSCTSKDSAHRPAGLPARMLVEAR